MEKEIVDLEGNIKGAGSPYFVPILPLIDL